MTSINSFFEGVILGFGAAVPFGPINILIVNYALRDYIQAVAVGFGAMSADVTYLLLVIFGGAVFMEIEWLQNLLTIFGGAFLLYLAYLIFRERKRPIGVVKIDMVVGKVLKNYLKGYSLTLLNPYTIFFWISVSAYINSRELAPSITLSGLLSAIVLWITLMPFSVYRSRHLISATMVEIFSIVSSLILAFFSVTMVWSRFF